MLASRNVLVENVLIENVLFENVLVENVIAKFSSSNKLYVFRSASPFTRPTTLPTDDRPSSPVTTKDHGRYSAHPSGIMAPSKALSNPV